MTNKRSFTKPIGISVSLAMAFGMVPAASVAAFADESEETSPETEVLVSKTASSVQADAADATHQAKQTESGQLTSKLALEVHAEADRDKTGNTSNSFRYAFGQQANISKDAIDESVLGPFLPEEPTGFDTFVQFQEGNYTGTDAKCGIDVSVHQGNIDWATVKASGVDFAIIRCGYGQDMTEQDDAKWLRNVKGCIENGIDFGVYLYSYATTVEMAQGEADHVLRLLKEAELDPSMVRYPIYYDLEDKYIAGLTNEELKANADAFCKKISAKGYEAGVYASLYWWNNKLTDVEGWHKWVAQYNKSQGLQYSGYEDFKGANGTWQFSSSGSVPGITGHRVDLNYSFYDNVEPGEQVVPDGVYSIISGLSSGSLMKAVDIADASYLDGGNAQLFSANGSDAQKFSFVYEDGFYRITNVKSRKLLEIDGGATNRGANVQQYRENGGDAQLWRIDVNEDGSYTFINKKSGMAMDVSGGIAFNWINIQQFTPNGSKSQQFNLLTAL